MTRRGFFTMVAAAFAGRKAVAAAPVLMPYYAPPVLMQSPPLGGYTKPLAQPDPLDGFLSECCETGKETLDVLAREMYEAYTAWCSEFEECEPLSAERFTEQLQAKGFRLEQVPFTLGVPCLIPTWTGITLRPLTPRDPLEDFIEEHCETGHPRFALRSELIDAYRSWCVRTGETFNRRRLEGYLKARGFWLRRVQQGGGLARVWSGIALRGTV